MHQVRLKIVPRARERTLVFVTQDLDHGQAVALQQPLPLQASAITLQRLPVVIYITRLPGDVHVPPQPKGIGNGETGNPIGLEHARHLLNAEVHPLEMFQAAQVGHYVEGSIWKRQSLAIRTEDRTGRPARCQPAGNHREIQSKRVCLSPPGKLHHLSTASGHI